MIKLKRGTGNYKNKLSFKCFNCGKIGHFSSKCPYEKSSDSDKENEKKYQERNKKFVEIKSLYSKKDTLASNEDDYSDDDLGKVFFKDL